MLAYRSWPSRTSPRFSNNGSVSSNRRIPRGLLDRWDPHVLRDHQQPEAGGGAAPTQPGAYTAAVDDRATLTQARSMLILLLAACKQTQTVLEAAANALDTELTSDLGTMIERTEGELAALTGKIRALPA
jgi:hypothetical protein